MLCYRQRRGAQECDKPSRAQGALAGESASPTRDRRCRMTSKVRIEAGEYRLIGKGCPKHGLGKTLRGVFGKFRADIVAKYAHIENLGERFDRAVEAGRYMVDEPVAVGGYHNVVICL